MKDRSGACLHRAHRLIGRRDLQRDDCNILTNTAPQGLGGEEQVGCYGTLKTEASTQDNGQRKARSTLSEGMLYIAEPSKRLRWAKNQVSWDTWLMVHRRWKQQMLWCGLEMNTSAYWVETSDSHKVVRKIVWRMPPLVQIIRASWVVQLINATCLSPVRTSYCPEIWSNSYFLQEQDMSDFS